MAGCGAGNERDVRDALLLGLKAVNGGLIVVAFALLGESFEPKRFAGIFSAAPTVALANLTVVAVAIGTADFIAYGQGMVIGAVGFLGYAIAAAPAVRRWGALWGSAAAFLVWFALAIPGYFLFLR
jgi:hypothetical protein